MRTEPQKTWLYRTMNDPALAWARPLSVRRKLAVGMVGLICGFVAAVGLVPHLAWFAGLVIAFVPLMGALNGGTRGLTELPHAQLDEREARLRDAAYRVAFAPALAIGCVVVLGALFLKLPLETRAGMAVGGFTLMLTLPTLYLAWTLPDEPNE